MDRPWSLSELNSLGRFAVAKSDRSTETEALLHEYLELPSLAT